jgi:adenylate cyclase
MVEIERKFLVDTVMWKPFGTGSEIRQGYLSIDPERVVRVRIAGEKAYLTVKGKPNGIVRTELEYGIPKNEAEILLKMCLDFAIEKTRYEERIENLTWEIDVFEGENKGLVVAEIELTDENEKIDLPAWIKEEVSSDSRYYNSWLSQNPFSMW